MTKQASPIVPTRWDVLNVPREEYMGPSPEFPGQPRPQWGTPGYDEARREWQETVGPQYEAWLKQAAPEFEAQRQRSNDWDRAARNAMATGRMTPQEVTDLGYRPSNHETDGDWNAPPWGRWRPLPDTLYHVTTNVPAIAAEGRLRSPYELDHTKSRGLGSYSTDPTISFTDSPDEARNIERAMREGADVASGRLPVERLVEMAEKGEGADRPWLKDIFGTHDWTKGNPQGLDDLLLGRQPFYRHVLPDDHPLRDPAPGVGNVRSAEEWGQHGYYPYPDAYALGQPGKPMYNEQSVYRNLSPEEKAKQAFEWWRNPWAPMRGWRGGPSDPLFASSDPDWWANLDPSHIGTIQAQPVPGGHGYPMNSLGEWRVPTGEAVNITHINGQPYLPRLSHVKLATPLYKRWVFSPASGEVTLADNTGDPLNVRYHTDLARDLNEPNLVHGYAYKIPGGWRLTDWDAKPLADNFIVAQVMRALQAEPANADWTDDRDEDWSRMHHSLPS